MTDPSTDRDRLIASFLSKSGVDPGLVFRPGTSVVASESRRASAQVAWYQVLPDRSGEYSHTFVFVDPEIADRVAGLASPTRSLPLDEMVQTMAELPAEAEPESPAELVGVAVMRTLPTGESALDTLATVAGSLDEVTDLRMVRLDAAQPEDLARIAAFAERCDPEDVEEAALDEVDETEMNVHVLVDAQDAIVAYASAAPWDWDPGLGDIGVLTVPAFRRRGLGAGVVAGCVQSMMADGVVPLYRHSLDNPGSNALAIRLGFESVLKLGVWLLGPGGVPSSCGGDGSVARCGRS